jgi:hypothetical protein
LNTTAYFEFDSIKKRLLLGKSNYKKDENIGEISKLIRSNTEKKNYFEKHNITKKLGFELHHIKPLFWVKTIEELKLTDNWKNMLYISAYEHSKITQSWHKISRIMLFSQSDNNDNLVLSDEGRNPDSIMVFENKNNLYYDTSKKTLLLKYNEELRKWKSN